MIFTRIQKQKEFKKVFNTKDKRVGRFLVIFALKEKDVNTLKLAVVVPKYVGKAVKRNKVKRWIKNIIYKCKSVHLSYLIILTRKRIKTAKFKEVKKEIKSLLKC